MVTEENGVEDSGGLPVVEIASQPPHTLNVTFLHPDTQNLICLTITVQLGGRLVAVLYTVPGANNEAPCSNEYVTQLLDKCHSIALVMKYIVRK